MNLTNNRLDDFLHPFFEFTWLHRFHDLRDDFVLIVQTADQCIDILDRRLRLHHLTPLSSIGTDDRFQVRRLIEISHDRCPCLLEKRQILVPVGETVQDDHRQDVTCIEDRIGDRGTRRGIDQSIENRAKLTGCDQMTSMLK